MSTHNTRENFVRDLSESVRYFANVNQYPIDSDEQKAYLEGVQTAIAMMYIDLTGTPKSEGMLAKFLHQELQKAREEERERIIKIAEGMKKMHKEEGTEMHEIVATAFHWFITSIKSYQSELDQPNK